MPTFTIFYLVPAGVFLAMAFLWYVSGRLPRLFAVLPVVSCYAVTAVLLFCGGMCHRVAHVKLSGLEMDLVDRSGKEQSIPLGGTVSGGRAEDGIEVPGLPPEALVVRLEGDKLKILPGPGYQRGILVRSGGRLVPLEDGGVPRLVPLANGDQINVPADEGGEVIAQWRLGTQRMELDVSGAVRWIGGDSKGMARLPGLAPQVMGLKVMGDTLGVVKGGGWTNELGVLINGRRVNFGDQMELRAPYREGLTTVALVKPEPLAGTITFAESSAPLRITAEMTWKSVLEQPAAFPFEVETGRAYRVGGSLEDHVFIKGLPAGAMTLHVSADGKLTLELTKDGLDAQKDGRISGVYPQTVETGKALAVGDASVPYAGTFHLLGTAVPETPPPADGTTPPETPDDDADGAVAGAPAAEPVNRWRCAWQPMIQTRWQLPNRTISLPLIDVPVNLFTRRLWTQRVFPLNEMSAREGALRSVIAYTPDHAAWVNGASLLQLDPALTLARGGRPVATAFAETGLLQKDAMLEILQISAEKQGDRIASSLGSVLHPATAYDAQRVALSRRFASLSVVMEERGKKEVPVLRVEFERPMIRSVSMSEVKEELAAREDAGLQGVRFGLNDRSGFSDLPHQITFPLLTRAFDEANADVEMQWSSFNVQDDFKRQTLDYGDPFKIGGGHRLLLSITKETIPPWRIFWVLVAGFIAMVVAWKNGTSFWWMALQFGVAFLTCNRVIFGQAVLVNPPFNPDIISVAMKTLVAAPVLLGLGMFMARELLPGRIEQRLRGVESRLTYPWLCALAALLVVVRLLLLAGLGAKEALSFGGLRVALSVFFVPAYLLLFAQACLLLWREKEGTGGLAARVVGRFALVTLWLFGCQAFTAGVVSDLGMFLYFVPMALVLATVGVCALWEGVVRSLRVSKEELKAQKPWLASVAGLGLVLPLLMMTLVFTAPKALLNLWPHVAQELTSDEELVTDSTMLRVLQFAHEDYLINLGTDTAERIAQDHAIMANYAHRGLFGEGYLQVDVLAAKAVTALNDNVSAVFIFAQFGVVGALAVMLAYLAVMVSSLGARESINSLTSWLSLMAGMSFALVSLYMMAANYGLLPFTGRNMYLLGLNSWSDVAESFALIFLIILGMARADFRTRELNKPESALGDIIEGNEA
ncbi:hypothetical protein [Prosthecobacter sp.]|uniref:hypothetical protein n=1 Tax=Prosthecobacter sp. TaxID=1965333 RepID=UPI003783A03C